MTEHTTTTRPTRCGFAAQRDELTEASEARARDRQHAKDKSTARERIAALVDADSFEEVGQFAGGDISTGFTGAAVITGLGTIDGRQVAVYSQDFANQGGTLGEVEGDKIVALMDLALDLKIPIIAILDSGGARIQQGVIALSQYGRIFSRSCQASGVVPQFSLIMGPCAGGAVYSPALTDFVVVTKDISHMFVTGPDVVRATTGEDVSFDELGGAQVHAATSGVAHYLAEDEADALDYTRTLLSYLPQNSTSAVPEFAFPEAGAGEPDEVDVDQLVPASTRVPYDMEALICGVLDHGEFVQVHEHFARSLLVGFGCMAGTTVGVVANQPLYEAGTLDVDSSEKLARFVRFCDAFNIPVVTLVDVPGYRPGTDQEHAGIIRRGAKVISAYATASVPLITVVIRKAYGGAYIVMGSKSIGGDLVFAWPGAEIAVMGAEGAVAILHRRELAAATAEGRSAEVQAELAEAYRRENINPNLSLATGQLGGIIAPQETRSTIVRALRALRSKTARPGCPRKHDTLPI